VCGGGHKTMYITLNHRDSWMGRINWLLCYFYRLRFDRTGWDDHERIRRSSWYVWRYCLRSHLVILRKITKKP